MNLNNRPNVSEMSDQQIEYELKDFEWEYIALADWARSDAQYLAGEVYLNERKESLLREKELRAQGSQLTPVAADAATARLPIEKTTQEYLIYSESATGATPRRH